MYSLEPLHGRLMLSVLFCNQRNLRILIAEKSWELEEEAVFDIRNPDCSSDALVDRTGEV